MSKTRSKEAQRIAEATASVLRGFIELNKPMEDLKNKVYGEAIPAMLAFMEKHPEEQKSDDALRLLGIMHMVGAMMEKNLSDLGGITEEDVRELEEGFDIEKGE